MSFVPPKDFPQELFQEFGTHASEFFPAALSDESLNDPQQRRHQFVGSWQAVRFRYRACSEANEEFKSLFQNASGLWREWNADEEHSYKMERCLYTFFTNGLSVFESFAFCLYFVGNAIKPQYFTLVNQPRKITLRSASEAFQAAFPHAEISNRLSALANDADLCRLDSIRNILSHRIAGMRSVRSYSVLELDGAVTGTREEAWHLHGTDELRYDEEMIQRLLNGITSNLTTLVTAAVEVVRSTKNYRTATP
jgi:hypothetical protein